MSGEHLSQKLDFLVVNDMHDENVDLLIDVRGAYRGKTIETSRDLQDFMNNGGRATVYFVDDVVPAQPGAAEKQQFVENAEFILRKQSTAIVYFCGMVYQGETARFCRENDIKRMFPPLSAYEVKEILAKKKELLAKKVLGR